MLGRAAKFVLFDLLNIAACNHHYLPKSDCLLCNIVLFQEALLRVHALSRWYCDGLFLLHLELEYRVQSSLKPLLQ